MKRPTWQDGTELSDLEMTSIILVGLGWYWDVVRYDDPTLYNANNSVILTWKSDTQGFDLYANGLFWLAWTAMNHLSRQPKHLRRAVEFAIWWKNDFDWTWGNNYAQKQLLDTLGSLLSDSKWDRFNA